MIQEFPNFRVLEERAELWVEESSMDAWRRRMNFALSDADDLSSDLGRELSYRNFLRMGWKVAVVEVPGWLDDTSLT